MADKKTRFWGEVADKEACKQLSLEGDYTIFMVGNNADYVDDLSDLVERIEAETEESGMGYSPSPEEIVERVKENVFDVRLPDGYQLVGLASMADAATPKVYGVVNLQGFL